MKNRFYTPQNFLAKLSDGKIISIDDYIENNITDDISCPCCNGKLTLRAKDSEYMQPHFKHENGGSCLDYISNRNSGRRDNFYRREMELTEQEVENYKERIESLEYLYEFVKRIKNENLTSENQKEFLIALSCLDYEDQLWVFNYAKNSSCLKPLKYEMAKTINNNALDYLNEKYADTGVEFTELEAHSVYICYKHYRTFIEGANHYCFYGYKPPLISLNNDDINAINKNIERTIEFINEQYEELLYRMSPIPISNVTISKKDSDSYKIYLKNNDSEFVIITPKNNLIFDSGYYYINYMGELYKSSNGFTDGWKGTTILCRPLGDKGKFTRYEKYSGLHYLNLKQFFPSEEEKKLEEAFNQFFSSEERKKIDEAKEKAKKRRKHESEYSK